jgi:beta-glucosidase-like glycosyl hydrolase
MERRTLEAWIGAVLAPEVRVAGTLGGAAASVPSAEYLARFPPAVVVAFGRTPAGARSPREELRAVREACVAAGHAAPLVACDLEQGAGLHFEEGTRLPPALALASAALSCESERAGLDWLVAAGELTAREARRAGVGLVLAPVADVNTQRSNPIVAVRSFGDEPRAAAQRAAAFLVGLHAGGALGCAKHFPGHGDTLQDSHIELARVTRSAAGLREVEFAPFRALIEHGLDACMVGHLDVPALGGAPGVPATFSRAALEGVLRTELRFGGAVLSDAMNMGALAQFERRYVRALFAGCDVLLCPHAPLEAAEELLAAAERGELPLERLEQAALRAHALGARAEKLAARAGERWPPPLDRSVADELATRSLRWLGAPWPEVSSVEFVSLAPAERGPEFEAAWANSFSARDLEAHRAASGAAAAIPVAVAVLEMGAWRGAYGLDAAELAELRATLERAKALRGRAALVWFGSPQVLPRWTLDDPELSVLLAFAPTPPQVRAVARELLAPRRPSRRARFTAPAASRGAGSLPTQLG